MAPSNSSSRSHAEKNAGLVMGTNNSSIVSKRSVERLYHEKPHFFQHFVRKPRRRSPPINRGYWLRMQAIDSVVREFLYRPTERRKVVINLGCGYDPLPFQWLAKEPDICRNVKFVDVDHPELMINKAKVIHDTTVLRELVEPKEEVRAGLVLISEQYYGVACDLADIHQLDSSIRSLEGLADAMILCLAEVSIAYMQPEGADAVFEWSSKLSDDVTFGLLEQFLPDGPQHPFAETMLRHFQKLQTPLRCIHTYPEENSQRQRFYRAGWTAVNIVNLWEFWSGLKPSRRLGLDKSEPFDEWEEFALFAAHYFLLTARTNPEWISSNGVRREGGELGRAAQAYRLEHINISDIRTHRLHGVAFTLPAKSCDYPTTIAHVGGMTSQGRTLDDAFYTSTGQEAKLSSSHRWPATGRQCHTVTRLSNGHSVSVGGRTSPTAALRDCYLRTDKDWEALQDIPSPRFRHCAAAVTLGHDLEALLVFGGKSGPDDLARDPLLWDHVHHWRTLTYLDHIIEPRFAASIAALGENHGLIFGGLTVDGVILDDIWWWELRYLEDGKVGISFSPCRLDCATGVRLHFPRFGASISRIRGRLLLIGGIATSGYVPHDYETISLDVSQILGADAEKNLTIPVARVEVQAGGDVLRPMLVGHTTLRCNDDEVIILGGGAVCFSFGTHWNSGLYRLSKEGAPACVNWDIVDVHQVPVTDGTEHQRSKFTTIGTSTSGLCLIERLKIATSEQFLQVLKQSRPAILEELDLGPCQTLWTHQYLNDKIGSDRPVVVHQAQGRSMSFQQKDFRYVTKPFGVFMTEIQNGAHEYLRSTSSSNPFKNVANLELDFPEIEGDFVLPIQLSYLTDHFHSSPLRITGDVGMWLHVDTMANVLCQIAGSKRLILFPPGDMVNLDFPPGSTTSNLEIFKDGLTADSVLVPDLTHPVEAVLQPGDVLFIPPLWAHTAAPPQGVSIAVNVFFRNLPKGYAAGKDIYGNRDLAAYENGRRDVAKIVKSFDDVPVDLARAYLLRLADELRSKATSYGP